MSVNFIENCEVIDPARLDKYDAEALAILPECPYVIVALGGLTAFQGTPAGKRTVALKLPSKDAVSGFYTFPQYPPLIKVSKQ